MNTPQELPDFIPLADLTDQALDGEDSGLDEEFSLDGLLAESMRSVRRDQSAKDARKRLAKGGLDDKDRLATEALVRRWELERLWTPKASVIRFEVQHCSNCGAEHRHFTGYFQRQSHKTSAIERWLRLDASQTATSPLPKEVKEEVSLVPLCGSCCASLGWGE